MRGTAARRNWPIELLAAAPEGTSDLLPSASAIYAKKVAALTTALNQVRRTSGSSDRPAPLIEKIVLTPTPGPERDEIYATLHGDLSKILNWVERQAAGKTVKTTKPATGATGLLETVVAGAGSDQDLPSAQVKMVAGTRFSLNLLTRSAA